jgi:uncharacterized membrane protein
MTFEWSEWSHLILRWFHIFAGILWIGSTWYFTWLDKTLHSSPEGVWMVHSGGFYRVEKQLDPRVDISRLHWFRFEALFTWLSGLFLLGLVYYGGGLMEEPHSRAIGLAIIVLGWFAYDFFWLYVGNVFAGAVISYLALVGIAWFACRFMDGRAAFIHLGAMMGTIMTMNVWVRILPGQKKMVAQIARGEKPDQKLADQAKNRSKHNTFIILPVLLTMISNHFPTATYGSDLNWLVFAVLTLVGFGAAKIVRER